MWNFPKQLKYLRTPCISKKFSALRPDSGLPPWTICVFLLSDCLLLDIVLSLSLALVFGTPFLPMSLQHLLCLLSENV